MRTLYLLIIVFAYSVSTFGQVKVAVSIDSIFAKWDKPGVPGCALGIRLQNTVITLS